MLALHRLIHVTDNFVIANGIDIIRDVALEGVMHLTFGNTTDGYSVNPQWLQNTQAMLAADFNGDGKLTAQDPAFVAANDELFRSVA